MIGNDAHIRGLWARLRSLSFRCVAAIPDHPVRRTCPVANDGDNAMSAPDHAIAVDAIYRAAASPQSWPDTLTLLADYVGAVGGLLVYGNPADPSSGVLMTGRLRDDLARLYLERYALNPLARAMAKA